MDHQEDREVPNGDALVGFFARHTVVFTFRYRWPNERHWRFANTSGFVMSISGTWFLITAAHWFQKIEELKQSGCEVNSYQMFDGMGKDAKFNCSIPFDVKDTNWWTCTNEDH